MNIIARILNSFKRQWHIDYSITPDQIPDQVEDRPFSFDEFVIEFIKLSPYLTFPDSDQVPDSIKDSLRPVYKCYLKIFNNNTK